MAPKKSEQPEAIKRSMQLSADWKFILKWLFLLGAIAAGVVQITLYQPEWLISTLMILGIILGVFYFDSADVVNIGLRYLIFGTVVGAIERLSYVGGHVTQFLLGVRFYLGPIVLTVVVMYFVKRYILSR
jgi:hypothetical protein